MTEFLTIKNFVQKDPPTLAMKLWYGFILCLLVFIVIYWIASGVGFLERKVFTVKDWELDMIDEEVRNG